MFEHLDDPAPPPLDPERRDAVRLRASRIRRRRRALAATASAVGLVAATSLIAYAAVPGSTRPVQVVTQPPATTTAPSPSTSTLPVPTTAPSPTSTTAPQTTAPPVTTPTTTTVPSLALTNADNQQHFTIAVGTRVDVHLTPDPSPWASLHTNSGNSDVLRQDSDTTYPDGSLTATFTAVGPGSVDLMGFHRCTNAPGGPATCTQAISYLVYITVTG